MSLGHTAGLFVRPGQTWEAIREKHESVLKLYFSHVIVLAMIPVLAAYYGTTQIGWQVGGGNVVNKLTAESAIPLCAMFFAVILVGVYVLGRVIDFFATTYGAGELVNSGVILTAYTATPMLISGLVILYPSLWVNLLVGGLAFAYSIYLLYGGLPVLMKIPEDRGFMFATSVVTAGLVMLVTLLGASVIFWSIGIGPVYVS